MQKYIEKMKIELKELKARIAKAESIIAKPPFDSDKTGLDLLKAQLKYMQCYADCLQSRIKYEVSK